MCSLLYGLGICYGALAEMTDAIDQGCQREQEDRDRAIANAMNRPSLPYTGLCHNCDEITGGGRRFCDVDCRDDYERRMKIKGMKRQ